MCCQTWGLVYTCLGTCVCVNFNNKTMKHLAWQVSPTTVLVKPLDLGGQPSVSPACALAGLGRDTDVSLWVQVI